MQENVRFPLVLVIFPVMFIFTILKRSNLMLYYPTADTKRHAETGASMMAATDLFGITYNWTVPGPPNPCQANLPKAESMVPTMLVSTMY